MAHDQSELSGSSQSYPIDFKLIYLDKALVILVIIYSRKRAIYNLLYLNIILLSKGSLSQFIMQIAQEFVHGQAEREVDSQMKNRFEFYEVKQRGWFNSSNSDCPGEFRIQIWAQHLGPDIV